MTAPVMESPSPAIDVVEETDGELRVRFPCLAIEGFDTRDGRYLDAGRITAGMLPMSVLAQLKSPHGGDSPPAATVVGRLDSITRTPGPEVISRRTGQPFPEGTFVWSGEGVISTGVDVEGCNVADFVRRRYLRGSSADLLPSDFTILGEEGFTPNPDTPSRRVVVHAGEIGGVTLVPIAAFGECFVELTEEAMVPDPITVEELPAGLMAAAAPAWRAVEIGDKWRQRVGITAAADGGTYVEQARTRLMAELGDALDGLSAWGVEDRERLVDLYTLLTLTRGAACTSRDIHDAWSVATQWVEPHHAAIVPFDELPLNVQAQDDQFRDAVIAAAPGSPGSNESNGSSVTASGLPALPVEDIYLDDVVTASATPRVRPPLSRFTDPGFTEETPITIEEPYVYGHLAPWNRPHLSFNGKPVYAPRSHTDYREFMRGGVRVDDNGTIRVAATGHLTFDTSHAGLSLSASETARHYDHTGYSWARVAAGEDQFGIWVAGVLRPGITEDQVDTALAHPPSGDWRPVGDSLELVAALSVNTAGFGVPRARVASGHIQSLVAGGGLQPQRVSNGLCSSGVIDLDYDTLAEAIATRLGERAEAGELSAAHAALITDLDDTEALVAALFAEVDDAPQLMAELLAELDGDVEAFDVSRMPAQLRESYLHGEVAARIRWGTSGDWRRCVAQAKVHGMGRKAEGACATLHKAAVGFYPGDKRNT